MTGPDDELAELFRAEATRRIDAMDAALLEIEAGNAGAETVTGLFREAHTIKGAAGMVGLDDIRVVAHAVEDILAVLREQGSFPPSLVPGLLRATGLMRTQVAGPGPPGRPGAGRTGRGPDRADRRDRHRQRNRTSPGRFGRTRAGRTRRRPHPQPGLWPSRPPHRGRPLPAGPARWSGCRPGRSTRCSTWSARWC